MAEVLKYLTGFLFVFCFFLSGGSLSEAAVNASGVKTIELATITNDRDTSLNILNLVVNKKSQVLGLLLVTKVPAKENGQKKYRVTKKIDYPVKKIESKNGIVLGQGQGVKAILMNGKINSDRGSGQLKIKYLSNGLLMHYNSCNIKLQKQTNDSWALVNAYNGKVIKNINVKTWFLGISTLQNVCPKSS